MYRMALNFQLSPSPITPKVSFIVSTMLEADQALIHADSVQGRCNSDPNARSVTVMVTDACPECEPDHIDIQALTFNKVNC